MNYNFQRIEAGKRNQFMYTLDLFKWIKTLDFKDSQKAKVIKGRIIV